MTTKGESERNYNKLITFMSSSTTRCGVERNKDEKIEIHPISNNECQFLSQCDFVVIYDIK